MTTHDDDRLRATIGPIVASIDLEDGRDVIAKRLRRARTVRTLGGVTVLILVAGLFLAGPWKSHDTQISVGTKRLPSATTVTATPTTTTPGTVFTVEKAQLTATYIPPGFVPVKNLPRPGSCRPSCPHHIDGPVPGWTSDSQFFRDDATGQGFVMTVQRGEPFASIVAPGAAWPYVRSPVRVSGHITYVQTIPLGTPNRFIAWFVGPNTTGLVGGVKLTDSELLRIADGMNIAP